MKMILNTIKQLKSNSLGEVSNNLRVNKLQEINCALAAESISHFEQELKKMKITVWIMNKGKLIFNLIRR